MDAIRAAFLCLACALLPWSCHSLAGGDESAASNAAGGRPAALKAGARPVALSDDSPSPRISAAEVRRLTRLVRDDPAANLEPLVRALVSGSRDDCEKARVIHDWVSSTIRYDADAFYGRSPMLVHPMEVLSKGASVCAGYSNLYAAMCGYAGLECVVVDGYARGVGFSPLHGMDEPFKSNHAWNAVRIDGLWYLVDCTWDAGYLDPATQRFGADFGTEYLFPEPRAFLHTHFPTDPAWQLVDRPLSYREFCRLPYLRGKFFQHGLDLDPGISMMTTLTDMLDFTLKAPEPGAVMVEIRGQGAEGQKLFLTRESGALRCRAAIPAPGLYHVRFFAGIGQKKGAGQSYVGVGEFAVKASAGTRKVFPQGGSLTFPEVIPEFALPYDPEVGEEAELLLHAPEDVSISAALCPAGSRQEVPRRAMVSRSGKSVTIRVCFPKPGDYHVRINAIHKGGRDTVWDLLAACPMQARGGTPREFPLLFSPYFDEDWTIVGPLYRPLSAGAEVSFEVIAPANGPADRRVEVLVGKRTVALKPGVDGRFRGVVRAQGTQMMILLGQGRTYTGLARYEVR